MCVLRSAGQNRIGRATQLFQERAGRADTAAPNPGGSALTEPAPVTLPEPRQDNCPTPENVCSLYHPGSVPLAYCLGTDCFDMNYGTEVRVVAGDDGGAYPRRWFVWGVAIEDVTYTSCVLADSGNKLRVDLPEGKVRCRLSFAVGASIYHHHFAANPTSQCVGWGECGYPGDRARQRD